MSIKNVVAQQAVQSLLIVKKKKTKTVVMYRHTDLPSHNLLKILPMTNRHFVCLAED